VRLALELPRGGDLSVELIDLGGRRVRTLHHDAAAAGPLELEWDGRDDAGRAAPVGVYYARASFGGESASVRFARIR
jgi:flagellar hook assembly protein FlgD